jgi:para-nitrobenzyl esterase
MTPVRNPFTVTRTLAMAVFLAALSAAHATDLPPQVQVTQGRLAGVAQGDAIAYLGVPYAAAPVGDLRWRAPQPAPARPGVRQADAFAPSCMQAVSPSGFGPWTAEYVVQGKVSEDCLYLNVWTPAHAAGAPLPVLFWIHGGGFTGGSGSVPIYDGAALAAQGIVVIDINYRLGAFGFLALPELSAEAPDGVSGDYGLLDVVAALRWVHTNIAAFGGDANAITIAGQSAGAALVLDLDVSPLAKGLYARAIAQSGAALNLPAPDVRQAEQFGLAFAQNRGAKALAELRALPADKILGNPMEFGLRFLPVSGGAALPKPPPVLEAEGAAHDTPFLTGLTADEASGVNPKYSAMAPADCDAYLAATFGAQAAIARALYFNGSASACGDGVKAIIRDRGLAATENWARRRSDMVQAPVYLYFYDHTEPGPDAARYGAFHSSEIPYVFRTLNKSKARPFTGTDDAISLQLSQYWLNFVKTGNPNGAGLPAWPAFDLAKPRVMELGDKAAPRETPAPQNKSLLDGAASQGLF